MSSAADNDSNDEVPYFRAVKLLEYCKELAEYKYDLPGHTFVSMLNEVVKMIKELGSALKMARDDISEKAEILTLRLDELKERAKTSPSGAPSPPLKVGQPHKDEESPDDIRLTLQYLIKDEMRRGVEGVDRSDFRAGTRNLLRMMWFLDFTYKLLELLHTHRDTKLRECASEAYEFGLGPHHPWMLRKTIGAALYALPYREDFEKKLAGGTVDPQLLDTQVPEIVKYMDEVRQVLWDFYKKHGLTELP